MAVQTGYAHYVCDRCGKEAYVPADGAEASTWSNVQRISEGKSVSPNPITTYVMCSDCRAAYRDFDQPQDAAFEQWMGRPAREKALADAQSEQAAREKEQKAEAERKAADDRLVAQAKAEQAQADKTAVDEAVARAEAAEKELAALKAGKQDETGHADASTPAGGTNGSQAANDAKDGE